MNNMSGLVYNARDRLVNHGVVLLDTDGEQGEVWLNCFFVNDIAGILFKRRGGVIEVSQCVAETDNPSLGGIGTEKFEFRSREESLGSVPLGDEQTLLVHHPETHDFKYKVVVKPYNREVAE